MKLEESFQLYLPHDKRAARLKAASFDPVNDRIALGFRKEILEYDIATGSHISQFSTESEVAHLAHACTGGSNVLVASLRNGCFSVFDLNTRTLSAFHIPTKPTERSSPSVFGISRTRPLIFYARQGSNSITGIEIFCDSKNSANYPHKKQITALTVHPNKSLMCSASIDGVIKIWETETHLPVVVFEESGVDKKNKSAVTALCFYRNDEKKASDILITGTKNGRVQIWAISPETSPRIIGSTNLSQWITSLFFHPTLPCFFALTAKGCLRAISVNHIINAKDIPTMKGLLSDFDMIQPLFVPLHDITYRTNTKNLKNLIPVVSAAINEKNGLIAFFGKNFQLMSINSSMNTLPSTYPIYSISPSFAFTANYPIILSSFLESEEYNVNGSVVYVEAVLGGAMVSNWSAAEDVTQNMQLVKPSQIFDPLYRITAAKFSSPRDSVLIFYERSSTSSYSQAGNRFQFQKVVIKGKAGASSLNDGIDGGWLGDRYLTLSEDGWRVTLYTKDVPEVITLATKVSRIFCFNIDEGTVIYHSTSLNALGYATVNGPHRLQFNNDKIFYLRANETPIDLHYQCDTLAGSFLALVTTHRVLILSTDLQILSSMEANTNRKLGFNSILWCGNVLLFNTVDTLYAMTPRNTATSIGTLPPTSRLVSVMPDRIVFATTTGHRTKMNVRYLSIAEIALLSILSLPQGQIDKLKYLRTAIDRFDCRTVSSKTLLDLEKSGFADLASEMVSQSEYNFSWELRFRLAKSSLNFAYAFDIVKKQFLLEAKEDDHVSPSSSFYPLFASLASLSLDYGQFETAEKCFEILNDNWSLFNLYTMLQHTDGLTALSQRCSNSPDFYEVHLAAELCQAWIDPSKNDNAVMNWQIQIENQGMREFNDIGNSLKGIIRIEETKTELAALDLTNLNRWMGQGVQAAEVRKAQPIELKIDQAFGQEFGRAEGTTTSLPTGEDSDTVSTDTDTAPKVNKEPAVKTDEVTHDDMTSSSEAPVEVDAEGYIIRRDQNEVRKKFQEESDSDNGSSDEESTLEKKRKKALRRVTIDVDKLLHAEADAETIRKNLGALSLGLAPPQPGISAASARRRIRGSIMRSGEEPEPNGAVTPQQETTDIVPKIRVERPVLQNVNPAESLKAGMTLIEKAKYKEARPKVNEAIEYLCKDSSQVLKKGNLVLCTQYKLLIALLLNIQKLETKSANTREIARCATLLSQINVISKHKIVCRNVSIKRNTEAGNYGIAASVLRELEPIAPAQFKEDIQRKLAACEERGFQNADKELEAIWKRDNGMIKFCWKTFEWIEEEHLECSYCNALFKQSDTVEEDDKCSYCSCGELAKKNTL